jgi:hypothetical protein
VAFSSIGDTAGEIQAATSQHGRAGGWMGGQTVADERRLKIYFCFLFGPFSLLGSFVIS